LLFAQVKAGPAEQGFKDDSEVCTELNDGQQDKVEGSRRVDFFVGLFEPRVHDSFKGPEYQRVTLPLLVISAFDCGRPNLKTSCPEPNILADAGSGEEFLGANPGADKFLRVKRDIDEVADTVESGKEEPLLEEGSRGVRIEARRRGGLTSSKLKPWKDGISKNDVRVFGASYWQT
jgi:hypothetical protein